mmetsp:Transcript_17192/g.52228  ORF Transcript_17192/g.52228 Transcript_17192/m.52228 type:complete len:202 (+) Transcript_17192:399-1004(+)
MTSSKKATAAKAANKFCTTAHSSKLATHSTASMSDCAATHNRDTRAATAWVREKCNCRNRNPICSTHVVVINSEYPRAALLAMSQSTRFAVASTCVPSTPQPDTWPMTRAASDDSSFTGVARWNATTGSSDGPGAPFFFFFFFFFFSEEELFLFFEDDDDESDSAESALPLVDAEEGTTSRSNSMAHLPPRYTSPRKGRVA